MPLAYPFDAPFAEAVQFRSGRWLLRGELAYSEDGVPATAAVVVGPHPLLGGTMENNVVRALGNGLARQGITTLRFDYRGVGASEGPATDVTARLAEFWQTSRVDDEAGYAADLVAAVHFLRSAVGAKLRLAMIGYSFGCSLLATVRGASAATPLVLVAPTVGTHSYESLAGAPAAKLVIAPECDFATDDAKLLGWFCRLSAPKELLRPKLDGHFFRGHEEWLVDKVVRFIRSHTEVTP
jgi:alpha/beta superfamily hydrolase